MTPQQPPAGDSGEISMLIRTLREADLRLEELTGGEVDSVADRDGRSFLLQRAQDHRRISEAQKQAAILNALPASIALLDAQGRIESINEAWRRSVHGNALAEPDYGIGLDYLNHCDGVQGGQAAHARRTAAGIRAVLAGTEAQFSLEYSVQTPTDLRWFLLTVTPLTGMPPTGATVMQVDITAQKRGEELLRRFAAAMSSTADALFLVDRSSMRYVFVNDAACRMLNRSREELLEAGPTQLFGIPQAEWEKTYDAIIADPANTQHQEMLWPGQDGKPVWVEVRRDAHRFADCWTIVVVARDITERKRAEQRIHQLNRLYAVLSGVNTLSVRARRRQELFEQACRIVVEVGAFKMAWIGAIDAQSQEGGVIAACGADPDYLQGIHLTARPDMPNSGRPACRALRLARPVICNDVATDSSMADLRDELLHRGVRSIGCFPLGPTRRPEAVLSLFADGADTFDEEELRLLQELAGDISFAMDHIDKEDKLRFLAYYDELTGLANRSLLLERVAQWMRKASRGGHRVGLFLIDLERFKNINYSLGRSSGDALLRQVGQWLTRRVGHEKLVARIAADYFAVVLPRLQGREEAGRLIEDAMRVFKHHSFQLDDAVFRITARVGIAMTPLDGPDADTLFKNAEAALQEAKATKMPCVFYSHQITASVAHNLALENQLRQALERDEFVLHYQPKVRLVSGQLTGAEALIRWNDPRTGLVPPAQFIPILEKSGLIHEVGRWALRTAIQDFLGWRAAGLPAVRIAVNVSPLQLMHQDFIAEIERAIGVDRSAAAGLELELTESLIMGDVQHSTACLEQVRSMGVSVVIDDFGTGFSSLSYLSKLPLDAIKIDRSFVAGMTVSPEGLALVSTIIKLAHSLKLKVIAEGVETAEQSRLLRLLDCDEFQGYLTSKPLPRDLFEAHFLRAPQAALLTGAQ